MYIVNRCLLQRMAGSYSLYDLLVVIHGLSEAILVVNMVKAPADTCYTRRFKASWTSSALPLVPE